jgi:hypothetical protein
MKSLNNKETKSRKPYIKPRLGVVSLVPQQTVLGACYTGSNAHPVSGSSCTTIIDSCFSEAAY